MSSGFDSVMEHASDARNRGTLADADVIGHASLGGQPPFVSVYVKLAGGAVARCTFEAQGCGYTVACCSVLTELVAGRSIACCLLLTPGDIFRELGELPPHRRFCATLAIEALHDALRKLPNITSPG
jgi:NifU-like protein involved in Fe-S cluster formation